MNDRRYTAGQTSHFCRSFSFSASEKQLSISDFVNVDKNHSCKKNVPPVCPTTSIISTKFYLMSREHNSKNDMRVVYRKFALLNQWCFTDGTNIYCMHGGRQFINLQKRYFIINPLIVNERMLYIPDSNT